MSRVAIILIAAFLFVGCPEKIEKIGCDACISFFQLRNDSIYDFNVHLVNERGDSIPLVIFWDDTVTLYGYKLKWKEIGSDDLPCDHRYNFEVNFESPDSITTIKTDAFNFTCKSDWKSYSWSMNIIRSKLTNNYHLTYLDTAVYLSDGDTIEIEKSNWVK